MKFVVYPYLLRILLTLCLVAVPVFLLFESLRFAWQANIYINSAILALFCLNATYNVWITFQLRSEAGWISQLETHRGLAPSSSKASKLLEPLQALLVERLSMGKDIRLTAADMRSLLDSVGLRMDERRDISRYLTNMLVFLGLLGTFWGLQVTVSSIAEVFFAPQLDMETLGIQDFVAMLDAPIRGMGLAFSSSLFGLAGSVVSGILGLLSNQAQNSFYQKLENWLLHFTRFADSGTHPEGKEQINLELLVGIAKRLENIVTHNDQALTERKRTTEVQNGLLNVVTELHNTLKRGSFGTTDAAKLHQSLVEITAANKALIGKANEQNETLKELGRNLLHVVRSSLETEATSKQGKSQ